MGFEATGIEGLLVYTPKVFGDERGFFLESYNREVFAANGLNIDFIQDNHARSKQKGVLRGLHFQAPPMDQTKLVRVTRGEVVDIVVDIRQGSPSYGKSYAVHLSEANHKQLLVPSGFAHGYMTLTDDVEFLYKVDKLYSPAHEGGLRWDDPDLGLTWPDVAPILAKRDTLWPAWRDFVSPFKF